MIYTRVNVAGGNQMVRVDLWADANKAQVRWGGFDSGEFHVRSVRIR